MIRFIWTFFVLFVATIFFGLVAIVGALFRVRGRLYFWATQSWSRAVLWASGTPVVVHGLDAVDWEGPQVLVSNHIAQFDILSLASVLPAPFYFVGKKELDSIPFFGMAWKAAGHISIDRSDRQKALASLRRAAETLRRDGGTVIIFPEGTRSPDGELLPFKKGAFTLAMEANVPLVPAIIHGSERVVGPGWKLTPHPIHIYVGAPVHLEPGSGTDATLAAVRARMEEMKAAVQTRMAPLP